ncbi:MAG: 6,7-dimethyl-8-ribityllumazine synthase [Actinomycetota bacterium]|jgi:6,7-dimethyl-8-ribityllumazine synthase|nr:6,7-dimethyl-8-ribityllumazine synthase [Actinomycetota bacterium]
MSGAGSPSLAVDGSGLRVAIVSAAWHQQVMAGLIDGARRTAQSSGAHVEEFAVPGSFELPVVSAECAASGRFDAIVALGVVIRGGTPHFDYVCSAATDGLTRVAIDFRIPVGFGLLTCDNEDQALDRAGLPGSREDKGAEAMASALRTAQTLAALRKPNT